MKRPLKVGDRVRVYGYTEGGVFTAGDVFEVVIGPTLDDHIGVRLCGHSRVMKVHSKQCRRLIPKKPRRRVWARLNRDGSVYDFSEKPVTHDLFPNGPWHEFIEVKKK